MYQMRAFRVLILGLFLFCFTADRLHCATYYNFQEYHGNGVDGPIGGGTLQMSNNTSTVKANFIKGMGTFTDVLVMFIDSVPGGYTSTSPFSDKGNNLETAVSGYKTSRSVATFAPGFQADYAIALTIGSGSSALYKLVDDVVLGPHLQVVQMPMSTSTMDQGNLPSYSFTFNWVDIGLTGQNTNFFKFETTYITATGSRSLQSFEGLTGKSGFDFITFTNYDTYGVPPVPENTKAALVVFGGLVMTFSAGKRVRTLLKHRSRNR
jgi:hypothetical protein